MTTTTPPTSIQALAMQARQAAIKRLISLYQKDFDRFQREERTLLGLPPERSATSLIDEVVRLRKELAELRSHGLEA